MAEGGAAGLAPGPRPGRSSAPSVTPLLSLLPSPGLASELGPHGISPAPSRGAEPQPADRAWLHSTRWTWCLCVRPHRSRPILPDSRWEVDGKPRVRTPGPRACPHPAWASRPLPRGQGAHSLCFRGHSRVALPVGQHRVSFLPSRNTGHGALVQWQVESMCPQPGHVTKVIRVTQGSGAFASIATGQKRCLWSQPEAMARGRRGGSDGAVPLSSGPLGDVSFRVCSKASRVSATPPGCQVDILVLCLSAGPGGGWAQGQPRGERAGRL